MGNEGQKSVQGETTVKVNHPKFQNAKLLGERQRNLVITTGVDEKQFEKWKRDIETLRPSGQYLLLPLRHDFKKKGLCGDSGSLTLTFPNYSYLLSEEIYNRKGRGAKFQETELWYLLLVLAGAQHEMLRKTNGKVGDIRPHNVFLNAEGEAKVSSVLSWPREHTNFNKAMDNEPTYLAPEDMERLEMGRLEDTANFHSEVFSIGLSVLGAGMLQDFLGLYNTHNYRFDKKQAQSWLEDWRSNTVYSEVLTALISNLCQFRPEKRLDEKQLWQWISKFQNDIRDKQDFFIENVPGKVGTQIEEIRQRYPVEEQQQYVQQAPQPVYHQEVRPQVRNIADRSMVEQYRLPEERYYAQQGHQTMPPVHTIQREQVPISPRGYEYRTTEEYRHEPSPRVEISSQTRTTNKSNGSAHRFVNYNQVSSSGIEKKYVIAGGDSPPQVRKTYTSGQSFGDTRQFQPTSQYQPIPPQLQSRGVVPGQTQLPPQFVGRTITVSRNGQTQTSHQGYIPPPGEYNSGSRTQLQGQSHPPNVAYFQNVIDPQGARNGRIEQTMYVPRSQPY